MQTRTQSCLFDSPWGSIVTYIRHDLCPICKSNSWLQNQKMLESIREHAPDPRCNSFKVKCKAMQWFTSGSSASGCHDHGQILLSCSKSSLTERALLPPQDLFVLVICTGVSMCTWVCTGITVPRSRLTGHLLWMLGFKLRSSARAVCVLNHWTTSSVHHRFSLINVASP